MNDGAEEVSDHIKHSKKRKEDGLVACFEMTSGDKGESLVGSTSEVDASWSVTESAMLLLRRGGVEEGWLAAVPRECAGASCLTEEGGKGYQVEESKGTSRNGRTSTRQANT